MNMHKYVLKRILLLIPVLLGVSLLVFAIMSLTPGDPAQLILGENAPKEAVLKLREEMGLNDPFFMQYLQLWEILEDHILLEEKYLERYLLDSQILLY